MCRTVCRVRGSACDRRVAVARRRGRSGDALAIVGLHARDGARELVGRRRERCAFAARTAWRSGTGRAARVSRGTLRMIGVDSGREDGHSGLQADVRTRAPSGGPRRRGRRRGRRREAGSPARVRKREVLLLRVLVVTAVSVGDLVVARRDTRTVEHVVLLVTLGSGSCRDRQ